MIVLFYQCHPPFFSIYCYHKVNSLILANLTVGVIASVIVC